METLKILKILKIMSYHGNGLYLSTRRAQIMQSPQVLYTNSPAIHWNENVVILMKFSSLAALEVVKMTTFSAASDENFVNMTTFSFQCTELTTGDGFNIKSTAFQYRNSHYKVKTVSWPSCLYNGNPCIWKIVLYSNRALGQDHESQKTEFTFYCT